MLATITGTGNGTAPVVNITFPYLDPSHVKAAVNGTAVPFTWTGTSQITFSNPVASGDRWSVARVTPTNPPVVDFTNGAVITDSDLDTMNAAHDYRDEELEDLHSAQQARSLQAPDGETIGLLPSEASRSGTLLGFDSNGAPVKAVAGAGISLTPGSGEVVVAATAAAGAAEAQASADAAAASATNAQASADAASQSASNISSGIFAGTWPFKYTPSSFDLSVDDVDQGTFISSSAFASMTFHTSATRLLINLHSSIWTPGNAYLGEVGIVVDGVAQSVMAGGVDGSIEVTLPAGAKTVEFRNGALTNFGGGDIRGTFIKSIQSDQPLVRQTRSPNNLLLFYGDSITVGDRALFSSTKGYPMLVRSAAARSVGVEGYGARTLHDDAVDAAARTAFVNKIAAWNPAELWMAIGTNDYGVGNGVWSAADFGTAYGALLDALHAALPALHIYAQSPIVRSSEVANSFGNTLGDYRSQIQGAATARSGFVTFVDGTTIVTTAALDDGIHPTTAGHSTYATFVEGIVSLGATAEVVPLDAGSTVTETVPGTYRITKVANGTGGGVYNTGAYGTVALTGDFTVKIEPQTYVVELMVGISANPQASGDYTGIDHAFNFGGNGSIHSYHGGKTQAAAVGDYSALNPGWLVRESGVITWRYGADKATATVFDTLDSDATYFLDSAIATTGNAVDVTVTTP